MDLLESLKTNQTIGFLLLGMLLPWLINQRVRIFKVVISMVQWILKLGRLLGESSMELFKANEYMQKIDNLVNDNAAQTEHVICMAKNLDILEMRLINVEQLFKSGCDCVKISQNENRVMQTKLRNLEETISFLTTRLRDTETDKLDYTNQKNEISDMRHEIDHLKSQKNSENEKFRAQHASQSHEINMLTDKLQQMQFTLTRVERNSHHWKNESTHDKYKSIKVRLADVEKNTTKWNDELHLEYRLLQSDVVSLQRNVDTNGILLRILQDEQRVLRSNERCPSYESNNFTTPGEGRSRFGENNDSNRSTCVNASPIAPSLPVTTFNEVKETVSRPNTPLMPKIPFVANTLKPGESSIDKVYERYVVTPELLKTVKLKPRSTKPRPKITPKPRGTVSKPATVTNNSSGGTNTEKHDGLNEVSTKETVSEPSSSTVEKTDLLNSTETVELRPKLDVEEQLNNDHGGSVGNDESNDTSIV